MLKEIQGVMQDDPASERRWYHDDDFDLYVRQTGDELVAFELCYGSHAYERALAWIKDRGYYHDGDMAAGGEFIGAQVASGVGFEADPVISRFMAAASSLPDALRRAMEARLREYALQNADGAARRSRFRRAPWQQKSGPKEDEDRIP